MQNLKFRNYAITQFRNPKKNVAQGRFEYSHSPDNRALTKPYPVTTYLVAN